MQIYTIDKELQDTLILLAQKLNKKDYLQVIGIMNLFFMGCSMGLGDNPAKLMMICDDIYKCHGNSRSVAKILKLVKK